MVTATPREDDDASAASGSGAALDRGTSFISQASRPDYLSSLRRGRIPSLRLEGASSALSLSSSSSPRFGGAVVASPSSMQRDATTTRTGTNTSAATNTEELDVAEFRRRLTYIRDAKSKRCTFLDASIIDEEGGGGRRAPTLQKVEVRINDYSYHVPVRVDAPSIKTVFNTSPCYVATTILKNVVELATGKRQVCACIGREESLLLNAWYFNENDAQLTITSEFITRFFVICYVSIHDSSCARKLSSYSFR